MVCLKRVCFEKFFIIEMDYHTPGGVVDRYGEGKKKVPTGVEGRD